jgi:hypothetical protein
MNMIEVLEEHERQCMQKLPRIYVTWVWVVGILAATAFGIGAMSWNMSARISKIEYQLDKQDLILQKVSGNADKIDILIRRIGRSGDKIEMGDRR